MSIFYDNNNYTTGISMYVWMCVSVSVCVWWYNRGKKKREEWCKKRKKERKKAIKKERKERNHHHHHVAPSARISLTLSCHRSLSSITSGRSSRLYRHVAVVRGSSWLSCLWLSMWRGPQEYTTYEFIPTFSVVSRMSGLSNLDSFHDEW